MARGVKMSPTRASWLGRPVKMFHDATSHASSPAERLIEVVTVPQPNAILALKIIFTGRFNKMVVAEDLRKALRRAVLAARASLRSNAEAKASLAGPTSRTAP